jgi:hypothetical protein
MAAPDPLHTLPRNHNAALTGAALPAWAKQPTSHIASDPLKEFLTRLGIGIGILSAVLLLIGAVGIISEPIALTACFLGIATALGLIAGGKIWLIVIAFQESAVQGLLVLLVPYYWIIYPATRKGKALLPLALIISALAPVLICLAMIPLFFPHFQDGPRFNRRRPGLSGAEIAKIEAQIREAQATSPDAQVRRTVSFPTFEQLHGPIDPARAEQVLAELPGYVPGSFRFNAPQRIVAFQYLGPKEIASRYGLVLAARTKMFIGLQPTFSDGPLPPAENAVAANQPARDPFQVAPPPIPVVAPPAPIVDGTNELRTVSFQTLGQGDVNPTAAEQALAPITGYVAGSFRFDAQNQQATLQYRGTEPAAMQFGTALQQKLGMMVRLRPTFTNATLPANSTP